MFLSVTVSSKEKNVLNNFLSFFLKIKFPVFLLKQTQKINKKSFVTILKSPHVNKTAQEQFKFKIFTKQILLFTSKPFLLLLVLKKIKSSTFSGVNIQIKCFLEKTKKTKKFILLTDPDNMLLKRGNCKKKLKTYLQLFDCYGEISLQT